MPLCTAYEKKKEEKRRKRTELAKDVSSSNPALPSSNPPLALYISKHTFMLDYLPHDTTLMKLCKAYTLLGEELKEILPSPIKNILEEFVDVFPEILPVGIPPIRGIEHQIDFIPGATLPNRPAYRTNQQENQEIQTQFL